MIHHNLYQKLGISSDEEAEELEFELELRFEDFTPRDCRTWLQQSDYLEHYARTGTVTSAAKKVGVTVYTAQRWKDDNMLGFTRRLEIAALAFNDSLKEKALLRASDPNAPATLLIELLRAYIPEEFSRNGDKCNAPKSDDLLHRYRESVRHDTGTVYSGLRKLAEGAENAHPKVDRPTEPDVYEREGVTPAVSDPANSHLSPTGRDLHNPNLSPAGGDPHNPNLSPAGGETQRGGSSHSAPYSHDPPSPDRHTGDGRYPEEAPPPSYPSDQDHHNPSVPSAVNPLPPDRRGPLTPERRVPRAQRREQLRQQRKAEKKNTFPVKRF